MRVIPRFWLRRDVFVACWEALEVCNGVEYQCRVLRYHSDLIDYPKIQDHVSLYRYLLHS